MNSNNDVIVRSACIARRKRTVGSKLSAVATVIGLAAGLFLSAPATADEISPDDIIIDQWDERHVELKRALISSAELTDLTRNDRRRLSQDERDALSRELREAMTGIYDRRSRRDED